MKVIIVVVLCILFYISLAIQDGLGDKNRTICNIAGQIWKSSFVFNESRFPDRCDIIVVSQYAFDRDDDHVLESDKSIIRSLVETNKTVYTRIGFVDQDDWCSIFDPLDENKFKKEKFEPLINFLNTSKVNGLLINCKYIYNYGIDDFATKIDNFVSKIKNKTDNLKVGLIISGAYYENFSNNTLFNFTITNEILDFYVIDWTLLNECKKDTIKTGMSPINSTNPNMTTIEQVTNGVANSTMDKSKIYAMIQMLTIFPLDIIPPGNLGVTTYSKYCSGLANSSQLCINPSKLSYDQGAYAKKFYVGIVLEQLDTDDYDGKCGCNKFPVSNLIIDGWTESTFNPCKILDQNIQN